VWLHSGVAKKGPTPEGRPLLPRGPGAAPAVPGVFRGSGGGAAVPHDTAPRPRSPPPCRPPAGTTSPRVLAGSDRQDPSRDGGGDPRNETHGAPWVSGAECQPPQRPNPFPCATSISRFLSSLAHPSLHPHAPSLLRLGWGPPPGGDGPGASPGQELPDLPHGQGPPRAPPPTPLAVPSPPPPGGAEILDWGGDGGSVATGVVAGRRTRGRGPVALRDWLALSRARLIHDN